MTTRHRLRVAAAAIAASFTAGAALAAAPPLAPPTAAELPLLVRVKDDIHVIQNRNSIVADIGRMGGNVVVIPTSEGVVLVDAKNAAMHDDIVQKVRSLTSQPIRYVVFTHNHPDHTGGAERMKAIGATLVMSERDRANMARAGTPGLPQVAYSHSAKLFVGGRELQLTEHRGHTDGDTTIYLPASKILIAGDLVTVPDSIPPRVAHNDGGSWNELGKTLDALAAIDFDTMVPGHGPVLTKAQFLAYRDKVAGIRERFRALNREGKSLEEIGQTLQREFNFGGPGPGAAGLPGMAQELR